MYRGIGREGMYNEREAGVLQLRLPAELVDLGLLEDELVDLILLALLEGLVVFPSQERVAIHTKDIRDGMQTSHKNPLLLWAYKTADGNGRDRQSERERERGEGEKDESFTSVDINHMMHQVSFASSTMK
jgi:hypothetical protein